LPGHHRDQQPVKRIAVVSGKGSLGSGVLHRYRQDSQPEVSDRLVYPRPEGKSQGQLAKADLDGDFPDRPRAKEQFARRILQHGGGSGAEPGRLVHRPDERMRIDKISHFIYSAKSSSGASKSGAMELTVPFSEPSRRVGLV